MLALALVVAAGLPMSGSPGPVGSPAIGTYTLPSNVVGGEAGKGFTITGLARASDGTWWAGNDGRTQGQATNTVASVVHLSADFSAVLGEVTTTQMGVASGVSIQGVSMFGTKVAVLVKKPGTSNPEKVVVLSGDGTVETTYTSVATTDFNGLAYDSKRNQFIVSSGTAFSWRNIDATFSAATPNRVVTVSGIDQLFYNAADDTVYASGGVNGSDGTVRKYNAESLALISTETFAGSVAVEGCVIFDGKMAIANDAWFHNGSTVPTSIDFVRVYALPASFGGA